ncbi:PREDICTED: 21 kDa protein-like [Prunus mume]|uniref:21 kDa protein-like n=1 Tax=Prunus mume TaxID=102107 RepID=A0ABM1LIZ0_PRUMU|nr:PREDICTED: 21 kDa protein-like [Prunus mume]
MYTHHNKGTKAEASRELCFNSSPKTMNTTKSMTLFQLSLIIFVFFFTLHPNPTLGSPTNDADFIRTSCGTTLYPQVCYTSLSRYASAIQNNPAQLAKVAISVSLAKARRMAAYVSDISRQADYGADPRSASALHDCFSNFDEAVDQIHDSLTQMRQLSSPAGSGGGSFLFQMSNVQTWMSAALTDEETCTDGFEDVAEGPLKTDVIKRVENVKKVTSNALALVNSFAEKGAGAPTPR